MLKNIKRSILSVKNLKFALLVTLLFTVVQSCIVVKKDSEQIEREPEISLSPKPRLKMSDDLIRSSQGDMISFIPEGWFFVAANNELSPDIIAVAVNPEYNLNAVFSVIRNNASAKGTIDNEGLFGLARISFQKKERKTAGAIKQIGKYQGITMGNQQFVKYEYSATGGVAVAKTVVFRSSTDDYYEFTLTPLQIDNNKLPSKEEFDDAFQSILASIRY